MGEALVGHVKALRLLLAGHLVVIGPCIRIKNELQLADACLFNDHNLKVSLIMI